MTWEKMISSQIGQLSTKFVRSSQDLLALADTTNEIAPKLTIRCLLIRYLGYYIEDAYFPAAENFLVAQTREMFSFTSSADIKRGAIEAIGGVATRFNDERAFDAVTDQYGSNRLVDDAILRVLINIDWRNIPKNKVAVFAEKLFETRRQLLRFSVPYEVLLRIATVYDDLVEPFIEPLVLNWHEDHPEDIAWFLSNLSGKQNLEEKLRAICLDIIRMIDTKNSQITSSSSSISYGGHSLFHIVIAFINNNSLNDLIPSTLDVFKRVLYNEFQGAAHKLSCLDALQQLVHKTDNLREIPINFVDNDAISLILQSRSSDFEHYAKERLELYLYKFLANDGKLSNPNSVFAKCLEYSAHSFSDVRRASLITVEALISRPVYADSAKQFFYEMSFDIADDVRAHSILLFARILDKSDAWFPIWLRRTEALIEDSSPYVRSALIESLEIVRQQDNFEAAAKRILATLRRDPHFIIRTRAIKTRKKLGYA